MADLVPDADVGLLYSRESKWAMEFQPPLAAEGSLEPDRGSYDRIFARFYEGLFGAGLQADVVYASSSAATPTRSSARWPVLVVPGLYVADDMLLDLLDAYARAGGHLVLGFRSGYADDEARPRPEVMPGRLREAVGASYGEYTNLGAPVPLRVGRRASSCPAARPRRHGRTRSCRRAPRRSWATTHPHLGRWAAVTTHAHGGGRVTYVGTLPDRSLAVALARWLRPAPDAWAGAARDRHRHERAQPRGGTAAVRVELVMGARRALRCRWRCRTCCRRRTSKEARNWS